MKNPYALSRVVSPQPAVAQTEIMPGAAESPKWQPKFVGGNPLIAPDLPREAVPINIYASLPNCEEISADIASECKRIGQMRWQSPHPCDLDGYGGFYDDASCVRPSPGRMQKRRGPPKGSEP